MQRDNRLPPLGGELRLRVLRLRAIDVPKAESVSVSGALPLRRAQEKGNIILSTYNVVEGREGTVRLATLALALRARLGLLASGELVEHLDDGLGCEVLLYGVNECECG